MTLKEYFSKSITEAFSSADKIIEPKDKALAYAEIAKAIAMTGAISSNTSVAGETSKNETKVSPKESLKEETAKVESKKETKKEAPKAKPEPPKEEVPKEPVVGEEWTEEMNEMFASQIIKFQGFLESYGEENIMQCVDAFSEGQFSSLEDITPLNIDAFISYIEQLEASQQ